jgi:GNAT superfamily N-acetyltransferase
MKFKLRLASMEELEELTRLIDQSVRVLQKSDYTPKQLELALAHVYTLDAHLIQDGTYFVVENTAGKIVACGGWSKRKTLCGGKQFRQESFSDPKVDPAKIRAFYVHPDWARKGLGTLLLEACEKAAMAGGYTQLEMGSTLTGVALYQANGYKAVEKMAVELPEGESLPIVRMVKTIS